MTTRELLSAKIDALRDLMHALDAAADPTPLDQVQALRMLRDTADSALAQAVPHAIDTGDTWTAVGCALGVSRQAAWERYARK